MFTGALRRSARRLAPAAAVVSLLSLGLLFASASASEAGVRIKVRPTSPRAGEVVAIAVGVSPASSMCALKISSSAGKVQRLSAKRAVGGRAAWTIRVPASAAAGRWTVVATCGKAGSATSSFSVRRTSPPPTPPPIAGGGYRLAFHDEFNDGTFANDGKPWWGKIFFNDYVAGQVSESGGTLKITNSKTCTGGTNDGCATDSSASWYYSADVSSGPEWGARGGTCRACFQYGYFEVRMRATDARGSWPAFWLMSWAHASWTKWPSCPEPNLNSELDVIEWLGGEPRSFYGTLHRNTNDQCGTSDSTRDVQSEPLGTSGHLMANWHTYAVKWTATDITWYFDGIQQGAPQATYPSTAQPMFLILTMEACGWDPPNGCTAATPTNLVAEFDWVRVWQK